MDWQGFLVWLLVVLSALYVVRQTWRTWAGQGSSCGGCSCSGKQPAKAKGPVLISITDLTARLREKK